MKTPTHGIAHREPAAAVVVVAAVAESSTNCSNRRRIREPYTLLGRRANWGRTDPTIATIANDRFRRISAMSAFSHRSNTETTAAILPWCRRRLTLLRISLLRIAGRRCAAPGKAAQLLAI